MKDQTNFTMSSIPQTEEGWKTVLSPSQFKILRQKATEPAHFSGNLSEINFIPLM